MRIDNITELKDIIEVKREGDFITEVVKRDIVLKYYKK